LTDVVSSEVPQGFISYVIYYPKIQPYDQAGRVVTGGLKELLFSEVYPGVQGTYEDLLQYLRSNVAATLSK